MKIEIEFEEVEKLRSELKRNETLVKELQAKIKSFNEPEIERRINIEAIGLLDMYVSKIAKDNGFNYGKLQTNIWLTGLDKYGKNIAMFEDIEITLGKGFNDWVHTVIMDAREKTFAISSLVFGKKLIHVNSGEIVTFYSFIEDDKMWFISIESPSRQLSLREFRPYQE